LVSEAGEDAGVLQSDDEVDGDCSLEVGCLPFENYEKVGRIALLAALYDAEDLFLFPQEHCN